MKLVRNGVAIATAVMLVACQGSFSNGTSTPGAVLPPNNPSPAAGPQANAQASPGAGGANGTYPFSQAPSGLQCPTVQGFTCTLKFNVPPATPSPVPTATPTAKPHGKTKAKANGKKAKATAKPRPTASPSAKPSPSSSPSPGSSASPSGSASPAASPTPVGPTITIKLDALPKNAPPMTNPDPKAVSTTPLLAVRLTVDGNVTLDGAASADFTIPQEQVGGRGFAIQLFQETQGKHHKVSDHYLGSYSQSTLTGNTLHFDFTPPLVTVKKGETWLFVLYGDERPSATGSPATTGSPAPSGAPSGSPEPESSTEPTPTPSAAPGSIN